MLGWVAFISKAYKVEQAVPDQQPMEAHMPDIIDTSFPTAKHGDTEGGEPHECQSQLTGECCGKCQRTQKPGSTDATGDTPAVAQPQLNRGHVPIRGAEHFLLPDDTPPSDPLAPESRPGYWKL